MSKEQPAAGNVISFDTARAVRYIERAFAGYLDDPAESEHQRGYLAALLAIYEEGLGKGAGDDRLGLLHAQVRA